MKESGISKILVPVDFSPASLNALNTATAMAKRHDATILLLNVVETGGLSGMEGNGHDSQNAAITMTHHSEQELQTIQHTIIERFLVPCEAITTTGFVSASIIKMSTDHQVDIIVMGTHGSSGFRESFIGLNAFNVVKSAVCPVLTIPPQKKWESFKKILFPVRPFLAALEKYDFIRKIIKKSDSMIKILGLATDYEKDVDLLKGLALQLKERLNEDDVEASTYFKVGENMAEEVLKMAKLMETDLVIITAAIDSSIKQLFVDRYTQDIINHTHFPVLSLKPSVTNAQEQGRGQQIRQSFSEKVTLYN